MFQSKKLRLAVRAGLLVVFARIACADEILISDAKSQPESLTVAPGGVLLVGVQAPLHLQGAARIRKD